jgi:hypothetical protein
LNSFIDEAMDLFNFLNPEKNDVLFQDFRLLISNIGRGGSASPECFRVGSSKPYFLCSFHTVAPLP